jgi:hypothetical protein
MKYKDIYLKEMMGEEKDVIEPIFMKLANKYKLKPYGTFDDDVFKNFKGYVEFKDFKSAVATAKKIVNDMHMPGGVNRGTIKTAWAYWNSDDQSVDVSEDGNKFKVEVSINFHVPEKPKRGRRGKRMSGPPMWAD